MNKEVINFLDMIGVDTRYISLYQGVIYINNLKFSKFSRKREGIFLAKHPDWKVLRSKIFQKICIRASRGLSKSLNPGENIVMTKKNNCADLILYLVLEPYTRKYGININIVNSLEFLNNSEVDSIASSLTLDGEVGKILNQLFHGEKIQLTEIETEKKEIRIIYPLLKVPDSWIELWAQDNDLKCTFPPVEVILKDFLDFLAPYVPDVRENILKSTEYVKKKIRN